MWSVVFYIFSVTAGIIAFLILLLLFAPFFLDARICYISNGSNVTVSFWWMHPFLISVNYNLRENDIAVKIAWWNIRKKVDNRDASEESVDSEAQTGFINAESEEISETESVEKSQSMTTEIVEIQEKKPENVEKKTGKVDNLINRIKNSRAFFFLNNQKWRLKMFSWFIRIVGTFRSLVHFDYFKANFKAGLEDPAVLGRMYGYYQAILKALQLENSKKIDFSFEPVFMQNYFDGDGAVKIRSSVGNLLAPFGVAVLTFPYFQTLLLWFRFKRKLKKIKKNI